MSMMNSALAVVSRLAHGQLYLYFLDRRPFQRAVLAQIVAFASLGTCFAAINDQWRSVFPNGFPAELYDIDWTGSHLIAVGASGMVMTSLDGRNWTRRQAPSGAGQSLIDVCAAGNRVFACCSGGQILKSLDGGLTWANVSTVPIYYPYGIADTGTALVTVGSHGGLLVSRDEGASWVQMANGTPTLNEVIWTGSALVAVGPNRAIFRSVDDGMTWTPAVVPAGATELWTVSSVFNGVLAAAGDGLVLLSFDGGATWRKTTSPGNARLRAVVSVGSSLVGIASDSYVFKAPAIDAPWSVVSTGHNHTVSAAITRGDSVFAVGGSELILEYEPKTERISKRSPWTGKCIYASALIRDKVWAVGEDGETLVSLDKGKHWEHRNWNANDFLFDISATADGMIAATFGGVHVSHDDGESWQFKSIDASVVFNTAVAVGNTWLAAGAYGRIYRSTDQGATWSYYQHPQQIRIEALEAGGSRIVAAGSDGVILTSDDQGVTWTSRWSGVYTSIQCIKALSGNVWMAGGEGGFILRSTNGGTSWSRVFTAMNTFVMGFDGSPSAFVAVTRYTDQSGTNVTKALWSSNSGATWNEVSAGSAAYPNTVVWTGEKFVMMGDKGALFEAPAAGFPWTSMVGLTTGSTPFFNDVEWGANSLFAVGNDGVLVESTDHGLTWATRASGTTENLMAITWTGSAWIVAGSGSPVVLRSADNGAKWTPVSGSFSTRPTALAHGNGRTILAASDGYRVSLDHGQSWTIPAASTMPPSTLRQLNWADGYFYGLYSYGERFYRSSSGNSWELLSQSSPDWRVVAMGDKLLGFTPSGVTGISTDHGEIWKTGPSLANPGGFTNVTWTGHHLVGTSKSGSIYISGEVPPADYIAWAAAAGRSGESAHPLATPGQEALSNLLTYAWDLDGNGVLSEIERSNMPRVARESGSGDWVISFLLPPTDRADLLIRLERMLNEGSWERVAERTGPGRWQGTIIPLESIAADQFRLVRVNLNPTTQPRAIYRLAFVLR